VNYVIKKGAVLVVGIGAAVGIFAVLERNQPPPSKPVEPPPLVVEAKKTMPPRPDDGVEAAAWDACKDFRQRRPQQVWGEVDHKMGRFCTAKGY
jgi:hypothetical protein